MTNPRKKVRFDGIVGPYATFAIDAVTITFDASLAGHSAAVGMAASLSADQTVKLAADGDAIIGRVHAVESDGFATIQTDGFIDFPAGDGVTVTLGSKIVGALGAASAPGYIRNADAGNTEDLKASGRVVDAQVQTAVWVKF